MINATSDTVRSDWTVQEAQAIHALPFNDLLFQSQMLHRRHFSANEVQISTLLSIKSGGCPEDCAYCPQSVRYEPGRQVNPLIETDTVTKIAKQAKAKGARRFCMGAAWRSPSDKDVTRVAEMVSAVKSLGLETCATLGMLTQGQAHRLKDAGLDFYNHNLDTSPEYYGEIITTRTYSDRLETLEYIRHAGINVCCGGIIGMGESAEDRVALVAQLATMDPHPESVPINLLVQVRGTPLYGSAKLDPFEFVRVIALARVMMPRSYIRLSAGRGEMSDEMHALCFLAGANSIFYGEKLLTTANPEMERDRKLFARLGLRPEGSGRWSRESALEH